MSISSEISRIQQCRDDCFAAVEEKGGDQVPSDPQLEDLSSYILTIPDVIYINDTLDTKGGIIRTLTTGVGVMPEHIILNPVVTTTSGTVTVSGRKYGDVVDLSIRCGEPSSACHAGDTVATATVSNIPLPNVTLYQFSMVNGSAVHCALGSNGSITAVCPEEFTDTWSTGTLRYFRFVFIDRSVENA